MPYPFDAAGESLRQGLTDIADLFRAETIVSPGTNPRIVPEQRSDPMAGRGSAMFDRQRRPYAGAHEQSSPPTRPRSANDLSATMEETHLSQAPFERQRRRYSSNNPNPNLNTTSPSPPPVAPPSTDLRALVKQGTDFSVLSTSILLSIMRANNCPLPPGAVEKEDLVNRVEEMASFIVAEPEETPRVRDEDEDDCKICFERVADYCLVPCGHTGFCFMCARKMSCCPFCKKEVGHAQKLWKV
jgi:Zinc finger, C3HC4 type (RING finger)